MAPKRHGRLVGSISPVRQVGAPIGPGGRIFRGVQIVGGDVWLGSDDPLIDVVARLRGPATSPLPRPKIAVTDRPGHASLNEYAGRDAFEMTVPIMFDAFTARRSVEPDITLLERLMLPAAGARTPPVVRVDGPVPRKTLRWRIEDLTEVAERTEYNQAGARCRFAVDVHLIELVEDDLLAASLAVPPGEQTGFSTRVGYAQAGDDLYDVARREYGNPSRAIDLATANSLSLGTHFKKRIRLRLPPA